MRAWQGVVVAVAMFLCAMPERWAQTTGPGSTFEAASIKLNTRSSGSSTITVDPGRFVATNAALVDLIRYAYGFNSLTTQSQVVGGPSWITTSRFDIVATSNGTPTLMMLRALLEDRFKVMAHIESREQPIYALILDHKDGRLGPKIHPSTSTCEGAGIPLPPTTLPGKQCGVRGRPGSYSGDGTSIVQIARALGNFPAVGRVVLDRTSLEGVYDWSLEWTPSFNSGPTRDAAPLANPDADSGISIFSALREQLGLRLDAQRGSIEMLIVDHAEMPSPD